MFAVGGAEAEPPDHDGHRPLTARQSSAETVADTELLTAVSDHTESHRRQPTGDVSDGEPTNTQSDPTPPKQATRDDIDTDSIEQMPYYDGRIPEWEPQERAAAAE